MAGCLLAGLGLGADAGAGELSAEQIAAALRDAKQIKLSKQRYYRAISQEPDAELCKKFRLSAAQVAAFLRAAKPISSHELHYNYNELRCSLSGEARLGRQTLNWNINATGVARVWQPASSQQGLILACMDDCKARKPFDAVASAADAMVDHEALTPK